MDCTIDRAELRVSVLHAALPEATTGEGGGGRGGAPPLFLLLQSLQEQPQPTGPPLHRLHTRGPNFFSNMMLNLQYQAFSRSETDSYAVHCTVFNSFIPAGSVF